MIHAAIVGSGPSGLFLAKNLLKIYKESIKIDIFEKLPTPYGLLKFGIAPDHPAEKVCFRFFSTFY